MSARDRERTLGRIRQVCLALDWDELARIVEDAYAEVAPTKLVESARQKP